MSHARGTTNRNARGNSDTRRWRKQMLLERDGNGRTAKCATCPTVVDFHSMVVDCWPIPRVDGGAYDLKGTEQPGGSNNRIQCAPCSHIQGGAIGTERRAAKRAATLLEFS